MVGTDHSNPQSIAECRVKVSTHPPLRHWGLGVVLCSCGVAPGPSASQVREAATSLRGRNDRGPNHQDPPELNSGLAMFGCHLAIPIEAPRHQERLQSGSCKSRPSLLVGLRGRNAGPTSPALSGDKSLFFANSGIETWEI